MAVTQLKTSFEDDISGFDDSFSSAGCTVVRDASAARTGSFGLLHTTTAVDVARANAVRSGFPLPSGRVTTDVWFYIVGSGDAGYEVATEGWTGTRRHLTSFRWIDDTGFTERWQYWNPLTDNWSAVPGAAVSLTRDAWHHVICVMDWSIMEYIELIVDDVVYPMTGIPIEDVPNGAPPFMQASLILWTHEASVLTGYSDDFEMTFGAGISGHSAKNKKAPNKKKRRRQFVEINKQFIEVFSDAEAAALLRAQRKRGA